MNKITATGRLAADSELRFTQSGDPILNFRLASDVGFGDKKTTNWFACTLFGKRSEALQSHLLKGQKVTIFGTLAMREWMTRDGAKQLSPDIRIDEIELQGGKASVADDAAQQSRGAKPAANSKCIVPPHTSTPDRFYDQDIPL